jgi:tetratricopeptide (TPR) repeat protein
LRSDGNYDGAAAELQQVLAQYPRDRVALNDYGRILFLQRKYRDAVKALNAVLEIDPEDLQAQYNLMLCYNGLGDEKQAHEHQVRYLRFKADEASQTITGPYRQLHPEDNNERQAIHEHVSVPLPALGQKGVATLTDGDTRRSENHVGTGTLARSVERSSTYAAVNPANRDPK